MKQMNLKVPANYIIDNLLETLNQLMENIL